MRSVLMGVLAVLAAALVLAGCIGASGPDRPGTFRGESGWVSLKPAPEPLKPGAFLCYSDLYRPEDFEAYKNTFGPNFSVRLYSGGQEPQLFGVKLYLTMDKVSLRNIPKEGESWFNTYPRELWGQTVLEIGGGDTWVQDEIIDRAIMRP